MKNAFLLLILTILSQICNGQQQAYFIGSFGMERSVRHLKDNSNQSQLMLIRQNGDQEIGTGYTFGETVDSVFTSAGFDVFRSGFESIIEDSICVDKKWYFIKYYLYSDGGRTSTSQETFYQRDVFVPGIGTIYSKSNFYSSDYFMLCHSNPQLQKVLGQVYQRIAEHPYWSFEPWKKYAELTKKYKFESCLQQLSDEWISANKHLQLSDEKIIYGNDTIQYDLIIKNTGNIGYQLSTKKSLPPLKGMVLYDHERYPLPIYFYCKVNAEQTKEYYLNPNDSIQLNLMLIHKNGPKKSSDIAFDKFRFRMHITLEHWLLTDDVIFEEKKYKPFSWAVK